MQEALLAAWRGLDGLRDPHALRSWLYRITTHAALRLSERRGPRVLSWDTAAAADPRAELGAPVEARWVEPFLDPDPARAAERREHIELAWIAATQRLPPTQRAVVILREVLRFPAAEVAEMLDTSVASVNSALQRARAGLSDARAAAAPATSASAADRRTAAHFATAFVEGDVEAVVALLTDDVRFTMPPFAAWFDGISDVRTFLAERVFATPWRVIPQGEVNGYPALLGLQWDGTAFRPGALMILSGADGRISWLATFVEPELVSGWAAAIGYPFDR